MRGFTISFVMLLLIQLPMSSVPALLFWFYFSNVFIISISTIGFMYMIGFFGWKKILPLLDANFRADIYNNKKVTELIWIIFWIGKSTTIIILKFILRRLFFRSTKNTIYRVPCLLHIVFTPFKFPPPPQKTKQNKNKNIFRFCLMGELKWQTL